MHASEERGSLQAKRGKSAREPLVYMQMGSCGGAVRWTDLSIHTSQAAEVDVFSCSSLTTRHVIFSRQQKTADDASLTSGG